MAVSAVALLITGAGPSLAAVGTAVSAATFTFSIPPAPKTTDVSKTTIGVKWDPIAGAPNYRLQISPRADMGGSTYVRTTETSYDVRNLQPGTTYYIKLRVITSDADGGAGLSDYSEAVTAKTAAAPVLSPLTQPLKVASFNLKCANCYDSDATADQLPWAERRDTVVAQIKARMPDVIGFQEVSQAWLKDTNGEQINTSQFEDLQQRLVAAGTNYRVTNSNRNNCENPKSPTDCVWKDQGASQGTKVFYNADTVDLLEEGSERLPYIDEVDNQRYVAWGRFMQKSSKKMFLFADTHIEPSSHTPEYMDLKIRQTQRIADLIKEKNTTKLPVFIVGDLNSSKYMAPSNGPWDVLTGAGYIDPLGNDYDSTFPSGKATFEKRINAEYNSFNGFVRTLKKDSTPGANGKHLDYIFSTPMRVAEWEMVLNKEGDNLVGVIPADHNMILETVELPAAVSPFVAKAELLNGSLGAVTGKEIFNTYGGYQRYEKGYVLWSAATGAYVSTGAIRSEFARRGYETGVLGYPTSDIIAGRDGATSQTYKNGAIVSHPAFGTRSVYGPIREAWLKAGSVTGALGYPAGDVVTAADGTSSQRFQNGAIDSHPVHGAHATFGPIRDAWLKAGSVTGALGYPTGDVVKAADGSSSQAFQNGAINTHPVYGTHATFGPIREAWLKVGSVTGALGYPYGDVVTAANGSSSQRFQNGYLVETPGVGVFTSTGPIRDRWVAMGAEAGALGLPIGNTVPTATGSYQKYQNGFILASPKTGAYPSMGPIRSAFAKQGYEGGKLGYPTSEVYTTSNGGTAQTYQGGIITRTKSGATSIKYS
ncbi:MAG TPA: endonuclease/exonuclease/phosphatase family protein [Arthrobacter sp.]